MSEQKKAKSNKSNKTNKPKRDFSQKSYQEGRIRQDPRYKKMMKDLAEQERTWLAVRQTYM